MLKPLTVEELCPLGTNVEFTKSGVTIFAGHSGSGKSVFLSHKVKEWAAAGYNIAYLNYDNSPMDIPTYKGVTASEMTELTKNADAHDIIIVDTLKALCGMEGIDINSDAQTYLLMEQLTDIARSTNATIILVHHTDDDGKIEGSDSLYEGADEVTIFKKDDEANEYHTFVRKHRYSNNIEVGDFYTYPSEL
jgi:predicted ATP-dependent serine protease